VLFLAEVADTSLTNGRSLKLPLYAAGGIPEVWVINRRDDRIEVYREPSGERYLASSVHERGQIIAPVAFPDLGIAVDEILG
jgi:Uma2 family endonuclease